MKIRFWTSLICIKPNAERNVKPAPQNSVAWSLTPKGAACSLLISILLMGPQAYADESIPTLGRDSETTQQTPTLGAKPEPSSEPPQANVEAPLPTADAPKEIPQELAPPVDTPPSTLTTPTGIAPLGTPTKTGLDPTELFPPITANKFLVHIIKHSASNRLYLIQVPEEITPPLRPGELILLRNQEEQVMAFRIIRTTPSDHTVVGQLVKKYEDHRELKPGEEYFAIERISDIDEVSDIIDAPEAEYEDPSWETNPGAEIIMPYDPELDIGSLPSQEARKESSGADQPAEQPKMSALDILNSKVASLESKVAELSARPAVMPPPEQTLEPLPAKVPGEIVAKEKVKSGERLDDDLLDKEETSTPHESSSIDEVTLFDNYSHWLSAGFGYVTNYAASGQSLSNFSAGNIKYGVTLGRRILFEKSHLQDSLVLEGGIYGYKAINFATQGDSYTLMSFAGNLRYNLFFSEGFGIFIYGGALQGLVIGSAAGLASAITALNSFLPTAGGGILLQIGPSWFARLDTGIDNTSLNLLLRF